MDWFAKNASAIQAIASVVGVAITAALACITYWYVRVTKRIAESSAEQVKQFREASRVVIRQNARALAVVALRIRTSFGAGNLDSDAPRYKQLQAFTQVNNDDISLIETLAKNLNSAEISISAGKAVVAMREVLGFIEHAKQKPETFGSATSPPEATRWRRALEESERSLHFIQDECERLANS